MTAGSHTVRPPRSEWLPPLLVGASAAVAAEVALSLLLYGGPGFVRSLTTILAVEGFALAAGLWSSPAGDPGLVDRLRRRWLLCLLAFLIAALYGTAWSVMPAVGAGRWGQAVGLGLLAGLPLYGSGAVLGGIAVAAATDPGERLAGPGAAAAAGAALGFVLTGYLLARVPMPASMLVACLVMLSLGGMVFGGVLGARTEIESQARLPSRFGDVWVCERQLPADDVAVRELWEGAFLRRSDPLRREASARWDVAVVRALMPEATSPWRVLVVGGGASSAPRALLREHPSGEVDVAERVAAVVELGREHFGTELEVERGERSAVAVGNLDDLVAMIETTYDLVLIDTAALAPLGGMAGLSRASRWRIFDAVAPGGSAAWGPVALDAPPPETSEGWTLREYRAAVSDEVVVMAARASATDTSLPSSLEGFDPV